MLINTSSNDAILLFLPVVIAFSDHQPINVQRFSISLTGAPSSQRDFAMHNYYVVREFNGEKSYKLSEGEKRLSLAINFPYLKYVVHFCFVSIH